MTLIVSLSGGPFSVMAVDRLVSLSTPLTNSYAGVHDPASIKMIVLLTPDAIAVMGYTGVAYLNGEPTDQWIVRTLAPQGGIFRPNGAPGMCGFRPLSKIKIFQAFNRIRIALANTQNGNRVTIHCIGYRVRRKRFIPFSVHIVSANPLSGSAQMRLRPPSDRSIVTFGHAGAILSGEEYVRALKQSGASSHALDAESARSFLTSLIRNKSTTDRTVGDNVISATLWCSKKYVYILFDPSIQHYGTAGGMQNFSLPVAHTPWVLTPNNYHAPTESTGDLSSSSSLEAEGWKFEFASIARGPVVPSLIGWAAPQPRVPPPGRTR